MVISCFESGKKRSAEEPLSPVAKKRDQREELAIETIKKAGLLGIHFFDLVRISHLPNPQLANLDKNYPDEVIRRGERAGMFYHKSVEALVPADEDMAKHLIEIEKKAIEEICDVALKKDIRGLSYEQLCECLRSHRLPIRYAKSYLSYFKGNLIKIEGKYYHKDCAHKIEQVVQEPEPEVKEIKKSRIEKTKEAKEKLIDFLISRGKEGASKHELKQIADITDVQLKNLRFKYLKDQVTVRDPMWYIKTAVEPLQSLEERLQSALAQIEKSDREGIDPDGLLGGVFLNMNELKVLKEDAKVAYVAGRFFMKGKEPGLQVAGIEIKKSILAKLQEAGSSGIDVKDLAHSLGVTVKSLHNIKHRLEFLTLQGEGGGPNRSERWFFNSSN